MRVDVLKGAATVEIGNPHSVNAMIAQTAVMVENGPKELETIAFFFGRLIASLKAVSVNDKDNPEAVALWELWSAKESEEGYKALFRMYCDLDQDTMFELNEVCNNAIAARYRAPAELQVSDESLLDPKAESVDAPS